MIIENVEIKGFWGTQKASAIINDDVTIFIGLNGTGKTTFVNLIAASLSLDIIQLSNIQFNEIIIKLRDPVQKSKKTIKVLNLSQENYTFNSFEYKISNQTYHIFAEARTTSRGGRIIIDKLDQYRRIPAHLREEYLQLKNELSSLIEVSQISVYRQSYNIDFEGDPRLRTSAVDERLQQLFEKFARYQLKLETRLNEISNKFQKEVVASLLYSEAFDDFNIETFHPDIDLKEQSEKLSIAFKELGIQGKQQNIEKHLTKIADAIGALKKASKHKIYQAKDVLALPLIYRTNYIIDLLNQSEKEKNEIIEGRQKFFNTLENFMFNKKFYYDNKTSELSFSLKPNDQERLSWTSLSSGEKQLLIQFLEVLLHENRSVIFIADEPELSLHVTWQEKLLKAIRILNKNAQLIVATHSPDIVAEFRNRVIDMENVVS
jgi:predicted ATPase